MDPQQGEFFFSRQLGPTPLNPFFTTSASVRINMNPIVRGETDRVQGAVEMPPPTFHLPGGDENTSFLTSSSFSSSSSSSHCCDEDEKMKED